MEESVAEIVKARIFEKYNRNYVPDFMAIGSEKNFLSKIGLSFQSSHNLIEKVKANTEQNVFKALHYIKYSVKNSKTQERRQIYEDMYFRLRNAIVSANIGMVYHCISVYGRRNYYKIDSSELASEGTLTLIRCVDAFDPWNGNKLSTYTFRSIIRSFREIGRTRIRITNELTDEIGIKTEARDDTELRVEYLNKILQNNILNRREKFIICCRFFKDEGNKKTRTGGQSLEEIAAKLNLSEETIRGIQNQALSKMRKKLEYSIA